MTKEENTTKSIDQPNNNPKSIVQRITSCDDDQCYLVAEHFLDFFTDDQCLNSFDAVIIDIIKVYPDAVLIGAMAASKYIQLPIEPRVTFDIDLILTEKDFKDFLKDTIPSEKAKVLDAYFKTSESVSHSLKHRLTGIYIDLLSAQTTPIRKKLIEYILNERDASTNVLRIGDQFEIDIIKPEILIALKINRYAKGPRTEKGLSDRLDIVKVLKSYYDQKHLLDIEKIKSLIRNWEVKYLDEILEDVSCEMCEGDP